MGGGLVWYEELEFRQDEVGSYVWACDGSYQRQSRVGRVFIWGKVCIGQRVFIGGGI